MKRAILKIGNKLTKIGEKYNIDFLVYNPVIWTFFLVTSRREGKKFANALMKVFPNLKSAVDVGSGGGGYVVALQKNGIGTVGFEFARVGRILGRMQGVVVHEFDCSREDVVATARKADIAFSIEVGEHIPAAYAERFVEFLCACSELVVLSAAHPGQGGHGHINEQPKSYWEEMFAKKGYAKDLVAEQRLRTELEENQYRGWLPHNLQIFIRRN